MMTSLLGRGVACRRDGRIIRGDIVAVAVVGAGVLLRLWFVDDEHHLQMVLSDEAAIDLPLGASVVK